MKDLSKIRQSFSKTIRSMLHSRIEYPKEEDRKTRGGRSEKRPEQIAEPRGEQRPDAVPKTEKKEKSA